MKKHRKIIFALVALAAGLLGYKYMGFDDEPFDNLKAGDIERAFMEYGQDGRTAEITDLGTLPGLLEDIELEKRVADPDEALAGGKVTFWLYMRDGTQTFVAVDNAYIQTEKGIFAGDKEENREILDYAFRRILFDENLISHGEENRIDVLVKIALRGVSYDDIRNTAKDILRQEGYPEEKIKTFANMGYSPVDIFILDADYRGKLFDDMVASANRTGRQLAYEELAESVWLGYRNGTVKYDGTYSGMPGDFIFTDMINWGETGFVQNEMGYYYVQIPSADGKYFMTVTVDDTVYGNMDGTFNDRPPFVKSVGFYLQSDYK